MLLTLINLILNIADDDLEATMIRLSKMNSKMFNVKELWASTKKLYCTTRDSVLLPRKKVNDLWSLKKKKKNLPSVFPFVRISEMAL